MPQMPAQWAGGWKRRYNIMPQSLVKAPLVIVFDIHTLSQDTLDCG